MGSAAMEQEWLGRGNAVTSLPKPGNFAMAGGAGDAGEVWLGVSRYVVERCPDWDERCPETRVYVPSSGSVTHPPGSLSLHTRPLLVPGF